MKTLVFYEVNESALHQFPLGTNESWVYDAINNLGAATLRRLAKEIPGLTNSEINKALGVLLNHEMITRRTLSAHGLD